MSASKHEKSREYQITRTSHRYLGEYCPRCSLRKLYASGGKYRCENCRSTEDYFPDGDPIIE